MVALDLPSHAKKESTVKDLMYASGNDMSETIEDAGDIGGDKEQLLEESE